MSYEDFSSKLIETIEFIRVLLGANKQIKNNVDKVKNV